MDEIHVHKTKKSICAHFAESPCKKWDAVFNTAWGNLFTIKLLNFFTKSILQLKF